jgi:hypothetical protein
MTEEIKATLSALSRLELAELAAERCPVSPIPSTPDCKATAKSKSPTM